MRLPVLLSIFLLALLAQPATSPGPSTALEARDGGQIADERFNAFLEKLKGDIKRVTLPNGLRLIMVRRTSTPTVACYIKFKAGSADETDASSGIAHMLEHMLFKGTRRVGTRDYEKEKKYIAVINSMARKMDRWRLNLELARIAENAKAQARAAREIARLKKRMNIMRGLAAPFKIPDQDSYLYSLHGERGFNAYTTRDLTNYQVRLPSNRLEVWARIESDRIKNSVLRGFYTERNVVAEERRMRTDNVASRLLFERFIMKVYGEHPYARPVIGPMRSIQYLNYEQAYDFYKTYYAPNNTVIALVGNIEFAKTEALVRKYFGPLEPRRIRYRKPAAPVTPAEPVRVELRRPGSPLMLMSWFKPNFPDKRDLHLAILADILSYGRDSRLYQKMILKERIATTVSVFTDYPGERYKNLFTVYAIPAPGKTYEQLEQSVQEELVRVRRDGVTAEELDRIKRKLRADFVYSLRSSATMADRLSFYEMVGGDYNSIFKYFAALRNVTGEDIRSAAREFLKPEGVMTARLLPPEKKSK